MEVVFYNGDFLAKGDVSISSNNRAFNYGDGFFESIKIINSKPFNFSLHFQRIQLSLSVLKMDNNYTLAFFEEKISYLIEANKIINGSIKIHISRRGKGRYLPRSNHLDVLISFIKGSEYIRNDAISLCFYGQEYKGIGSLSNIKSSNALVSVLASIYAYENNFDHAVLLNHLGNIVEAAHANIFIVKNQKIYTPPLTDGCVDGTMRRWVITELDVSEKSILQDEILDADEVFVTNATSGVVSVKIIENNSFTSFSIANFIQQKIINSSLDL